MKRAEVIQLELKICFPLVAVFLLSICCAIVWQEIASFQTLVAFIQTFLLLFFLIFTKYQFWALHQSVQETMSIEESAGVSTSASVVRVEEEDAAELWDRLQAEQRARKAS